MKIMGTLKHILGMDVHYDLQNRAIHVSQSQYIRKSVKAYNKYGPSGKLKPYSTPMDSRVPYTKSQCPTSDSEEVTRMKSMPYRELIDTLLWVASGTRPDISYAVGTLAKFTNNPGEIHWKALLRVLGYLISQLTSASSINGIRIWTMG